jgi:Tfp pilus assembly protein PilN
LRPVNLIPPEQRRAARGDGGGRGELATRALLGALALAVLAVTLLVVTSNQINSKKNELADVTQKAAAANAAGGALAPYGEFAKLEQARVTTVKALAGSRFNWERVLRQLSRTIVPGVWVSSLTGGVSGGSAGAGGSTLLGDVAGPAVTLQGCAPSQKASALMVTRMRNLDGVTSVTLTKSDHPDTAGVAPASTGGQSGGQVSCTRYQFELLIGFAPVGPAASTAAVGATGATGATGVTGSTGAQGTTGAGQ